MIHVELIQLQVKFLQIGYLDQNMYDDLYFKCKKYGYNYVQKILEKLKVNEFVTTNLMFL